MVEVPNPYLGVLVLGFTHLDSWQPYRTNLPYKMISREIKALLLLEEFAGDILGELISNIDKDINKNKGFWGKMHKKYETKIRELARGDNKV